VRYLHAPGSLPASALDATYFKHPVSKWANLGAPPLISRARLPARAPVYESAAAGARRVSSCVCRLASCFARTCTRLCVCLLCAPACVLSACTRLVHQSSTWMRYMKPAYEAGMAAQRHSHMPHAARPSPFPLPPSPLPISRPRHENSAKSGGVGGGNVEAPAHPRHPREHTRGSKPPRHAAAARGLGRARARRRRGRLLQTRQRGVGAPRLRHHGYLLHGSGLLVLLARRPAACAWPLLASRASRRSWLLLASPTLRVALVSRAATPRGRAARSCAAILSRLAACASVVLCRHTSVLNAPDAAKPHRKLCVTAHVGDSVRPAPPPPPQL